MLERAMVYSLIYMLSKSKSGLSAIGDVITIPAMLYWAGISLSQSVPYFS